MNNLSPYFPGAAIQGGGSKWGGWNIDHRCKLQLCPAEQLCKPGEIRIIPQGQCCPKCKVDCSTVECPDPPPCTLLGESLQTPEGECCPQCLFDRCAGISCLLPDCGFEFGLEPIVPEGDEPVLLHIEWHLH